jgi:predicted ATP-dependent endonuclease of OLD family
VVSQITFIVKNHRLLRKEPYQSEKDPNEPKMPISALNTNEIFSKWRKKSS